MSDKKLEGRVAIVTGASRGIGKAIAVALADAGASVVVAARTMEDSGPLKGTIGKTVDDITSHGGKAIAVQANVADEESIDKMVKQTLEQMGHIDILVNDAGTNIPRKFKDMPLKHWDIITRVTLRGVVVCSKAVIPTMIEQKYGHIINISSVAAVIVNDPFTGLAYDVSKAGINRFTWGLAEELRQYNIAVNAFMPENTVTEGWSLLNPDVDKSGWQKPELWGKIVTFTAMQDPSKFTGKIMKAADILPQMTAAGWKV